MAPVGFCANTGVTVDGPGLDAPSAPTLFSEATPTIRPNQSMPDTEQDPDFHLLFLVGSVARDLAGLVPFAGIF